MQELGPKLLMSWLASKLVAQLISVTLFKTTRTIYGASGNGRWHMVKQEGCLCIFRKKLPRTHHFNMHYRWIGKNRLQTYSGLMLKCSLTMHILVMLVLTLLFDTCFDTTHTICIEAMDM